MKRVAEIAQLCFYLLASLALVWGMTEMSSRLVRMDREMDRSAILHDQMLKDHVQQLKVPPASANGIAIPDAFPRI